MKIALCEDKIIVIIKDPNSCLYAVHLIAVGQRMPPWVTQGFTEYTRRMPPERQIQLTEIPPMKRSKGADLNQITKLEAKRILAAIPNNAYTVALDAIGKQWNTKQLADQLQNWLQSGRDIALLIGGPEGLSSECKSCADVSWSLSKLTLPHPLVRIFVAEQLYRANCILRHHPYHK